jgi:hypothetical protein
MTCAAFFKLPFLSPCLAQTIKYLALWPVSSLQYPLLLRTSGRGRGLDTHPLAAQLHTYQNPEAISNFFERKRRISVNLVKTMRELMSWLDPTIHVLFMFSSTLGEGIGLVSNSSFPHDCSLSRTPRFRPLSPEKMVFIGHCNGNV